MKILFYSVLIHSEKNPPTNGKIWQLKYFKGTNIQDPLGDDRIAGQIKFLNTVDATFQTNGTLFLQIVPTNYNR